MNKTKTSVVTAALLGVVCVGCDYNPPPEPTLQQPEGGSFAAGDSVIVVFSEAISKESLAIRIWPAERDGEQNIKPDTQPKVDTCRLADTSCQGLTMELATDETSVTLKLDPEGVGKAGSPLILEVLAGLKDKSGRKTGVSRYFDFQFVPVPEPAVVEVPFEDGVYVVLGEIKQPIPAVLTLISEIVALPDGRIALAGAEGDETGGAPKNTDDPRFLIVDSTDLGFTVYATGILYEDSDTRFLKTDPFDIHILQGGIVIDLFGVRLNATVVKHPDTGSDRLEGTLSFEKVSVVLGTVVADYPAGATAFAANKVPQEFLMDGVPSVCGDLCGAVPDQCAPPADFPPDGFCDDADASQ